MWFKVEGQLASFGTSDDGRWAYLRVVAPSDGLLRSVFRDGQERPLFVAIEPSRVPSGLGLGSAVVVEGHFAVGAVEKRSSQGKEYMKDVTVFRGESVQLAKVAKSA